MILFIENIIVLLILNMLFDLIRIVLWSFTVFLIFESIIVVRNPLNWIKLLPKLFISNDSIIFRVYGY